MHISASTSAEEANVPNAADHAVRDTKTRIVFARTNYVCGTEAT